MRLTQAFGIGLLLAGAQTAQAQSVVGPNETCCPGVNANGQRTDPCFDSYQRAMIRTEALGLLSEIRLSVHEAYLNWGIWPAAADPRFVAAPTSYARTWVSRLDLLANGVLTVTLNRSAGGGIIGMHPIVSPDPNVSIYWQCRSPDRPSIGQLVPGCVYSGP